MPILLKTQVDRTAKTPIPACHARVGSLCRFRRPAERVPAGSPKTGRCADVRENRKFDQNPAQRVRSKEEMRRNGRDLPLAANAGTRRNGQNRGVLGAAARKRRESGGKAARFHATDICDGWAEGHDGMNYVLLSREIIADMVEIHANVIPWDGMVLLSSCDKSVPAHLIAAARLDLPTVHVPGGSQHVGPDMTTAGLCGRLCAREKRGEPVEREMRNYKLSNCPTCGVCQFMGTASTMQCMSEALGLALPGTALMPAMFAETKHYARAAGDAVMNLARQGITASKIMTEDAFMNAIKVHAALGGSTNAFIMSGL